MTASVAISFFESEGLTLSLSFVEESKSQNVMECHEDEQINSYISLLNFFLAEQFYSILLDLCLKKLDIFPENKLYYLCFLS